MELLRTAGGVRIAYRTAGSGDPPIVFVHGWCCEHTSFAAQLEHFARRHAVAALDLRGHGDSGPAADYSVGAFATDVLAVAARFDRPVVVGHSLGGLVALACAARPDAVRAAVLLDPAPILAERGKAFFGRSVAPVAADADGSWRAGFAARLFAPGDDVRREELIAGIAAAPPAVAAAGARAIADFDGAAALRGVRVPLLSVSADEPEPGLRELCPSIVLGRTVGAGHFLHVQVPDQVDAMIERFLARFVTGPAG